MTWYYPHTGDKKNIRGVNETDSLSERVNSKSWLEVLPSGSGTILAAILANIMTEGLTLDQQNILGSFISSVGSLISYRAARNDVDTD